MLVLSLILKRVKKAKIVVICTALAQIVKLIGLSEEKPNARLPRRQKRLNDVHREKEEGIPRLARRSAICVTSLSIY